MHVTPIPSRFPMCLTLFFISTLHHIPIFRTRADLGLVSLGIYLFLVLPFGEGFQVE